MVNERDNENIVYDFFKQDEMILKKDKKKVEAIFEQQSSANATITEILSTASKNNKGNIGKPEGIFTFAKFPDFVMFWEAKGETADHSSEDLFSNPVNKAVDGAIHYASKALESGKFATAVALGTSGVNEDELLVSYYVLKQDPDKSINISPLTTRDGNKVEELLSLRKTIDFVFPKTVDEKVKQDNKLRDDIHGLMRKSSMSEENKPLVLAGSLLALKNPLFKKNFKYHDPEDLGEEACDAIDKYIKKNGLLNNVELRERFISPLSVIKNHSRLHSVPDGELTSYYRQILDIIADSDILDSLNPDVIGDFYTEFLKYSGGDGKGLGIVLTPHHITELFAELTFIDKDSVILDTCFGTGSFLNSGLQKMLSEIDNDDEIEKIKHSVMGIEQDPKMFTLGATNMLLRGVSIDNFFEGSTFDPSIVEQIGNLDSLPNAGLQNPPYALKKNGGKAEIEFIENMLNMMRVGGFMATLVPVSTGANTGSSSKIVKERILKNSTLWAVMSLPTDLFQGKAGTVVQILVFKAGIPHPSDFKTWFADWKDDGFILKKHIGRADFNGKWDSTKAMWLEHYKNRDEIRGFSILKNVSSKDEWATETYLETDYTKNKGKNFDNKLKDFAIHRMVSKDLSSDTHEIDSRKFESFLVKDLFKISKGNYSIPEHNREQGTIPLVSASQFNNGVTGHVKVARKDVEKYIFPAGSLTIAQNGTVGVSFLQAENFCATSDIAVLVPQTEYSIFSLIYLAQTLEHAAIDRFHYGFKLNTARLNNLSIHLPAKLDDEENKIVDTEFIERFMKTLKWSNKIEE